MKKPKRKHKKDSELTNRQKKLGEKLNKMMKSYRKSRARGLSRAIEEMMIDMELGRLL